MARGQVNSGKDAARDREAQECGRRMRSPRFTPSYQRLMTTENVEAVQYCKLKGK